MVKYFEISLADILKEQITTCGTKHVVICGKYDKFFSLRVHDNAGVETDNYLKKYFSGYVFDIKPQNSEIDNFILDLYPIFKKSFANFGDFLIVAAYDVNGCFHCIVDSLD